MNLILTGNEELTMSSREIASLLDKQHSHIKVSAERMAEKGTIALRGSKFVHNGNEYEEYLFGKRDSMILVAQNSPEFTAAIVDRWQELESKQTPQLPQTMSQALQLAADQAKQLEEQAPKIEYHDKVLNTANGLTTTETAGELNMSAIKLNRLLKDSNVPRKLGSRWVLTVSAMGNEYATENTHITDDGKTRHSMKWTEKGRKFIHELITPLGQV